MPSERDVFGATMELRVIRHSDRSIIITMDRRRHCRDSLLYEQWATTRDLSWMRLMKRRMCVRAMRSKLRRTKARMWEGSRVVGVDKRIV